MTNFISPILPRVPATYSGVRFLSGLHARWAAYFDICGVRWEYRTQNLNGWVPDFYVPDFYSTELGLGGSVYAAAQPFDFNTDFDEIWDLAGYLQEKSDYTATVLGAVACDQGHIGVQMADSSGGAVQAEDLAVFRSRWRDAALRVSRRAPR